MTNSYEDSLKVTFKKIVNDDLGTNAALYATSLSGIFLMVGGVQMTCPKVAALCLAGVGVKAAVSYTNESLKSLGRQLSNLT